MVGTKARSVQQLDPGWVKTDNRNRDACRWRRVVSAGQQVRHEVVDLPLYARRTPARDGLGGVPGRVAGGGTREGGGMPPHGAGQPDRSDSSPQGAARSGAARCREEDDVSPM